MIVDTDNIVSANEIAERLGLSFPNVVHAWQQRHESFPQPVMVFKSCKLWEWDKIQEWDSKRADRDVSRRGKAVKKS